jgi:uncharacterized protein (DUF362 family)
MVFEKYAFLTIGLAGFMAGQNLACSKNTSSGGGGGQSQVGSQAATAGSQATNESSSSKGGGSSAGASGGSKSSSNGSASGTGGSAGGKSSSPSGGSSGTSSVSNGQAGASTDKYVVAMVQSSKATAAELTQSDVADLVKDAVEKAGGLNLIKDGQTVVLKPNLVSSYSDLMKTTPFSPTANGVCTDWRVVKAVADLVRAKNKTGKILVMEGSTDSTTMAFSNLGYTSANFGTAVDELIALEGASCTNTSTDGLEQKATSDGKKFWVNSRYLHADVVISLPTLKTHLGAGITGGVKNLGIGMTPVGQYANTMNGANDCTRGQTATAIDHSTPETLGQFIHDYYSLRPADFVVMDALQGIEHGPSPCWDFADYESSKKNMRMILAGKNAVAVDTVEALVMKCDPKKVPHLTKLEADGLGTTDISKITVVGKQISEVAKPFIGKLTDICPGQ